MHLLKGSVGALAGVLVLAALMITPAHAAPSQADDCDDNYSDVNIITIDPSTPARPGDTVTIAGEGFEPGVTVEIRLERKGGPPPGDPPVVLGTAEVTDAGTFSTDVTVPDLAPGRYTISAVSLKCSADQGSVDLTIRSTGAGRTPTAPSPGTAATGSLASTGGSQTITLAQLAVGLVALGGVVLMTGSRRTALGRRSQAA